MINCKVDVPEGISGKWKLDRYTLTPERAALVSMQSRGRGMPAGTYTRLRHRGTVVMTDTPAEIYEHMMFLRQARQSKSVLIHGLGLGMCLQGVLQDSMVEHVLIIEKSPDVIALVAPHYQAKFGDRLEVREGDAYTWKPEKGRKWDCVWHDVWNTLCLDNLPQMTTLHRRFGRRCDWQDSWGRDILLRKRRQGIY